MTSDGLERAGDARRDLREENHRHIGVPGRHLLKAVRVHRDEIVDDLDEPIVVLRVLARTVLCGELEDLAVPTEKLVSSILCHRAAGADRNLGRACGGSRHCKRC